MEYFNKDSFQVIIPSLNRNNHISRVLYGLSEARIKNVHIISALKNDPIKYSFNIKKFHYLPFQSDEHWVEKIKQLIKGKQNSVLLPVDYYSIEFVSRNKIHFKNDLDRILVPDLKYLKIANDKGNLAQFFCREGIATPQTTTINSFHISSELSFPILFKPRIQCGGTGIKIVNNLFELKKLRKNNPTGFHSGILQSIIKGPEYGVNILAFNGKLLNHSIQKDICYSNKPFSPAQEIQFINDEEILGLAEKVVEKLKWSGVAHLDLIYDSVAKEYKIIEINPRFWLSLDGSLKAGINFPELLCLHSANLNVVKPCYKNISYVMNAGLIEFYNRKLRNFNLRSIASTKTSLKRVVSDPLPKIMALIVGHDNITNNV
jgi:predicted ATP-grasp superfamily ATP-dependent carboligase